MRVPLLLHFPHEPPTPGPTRLVSVVDLLPTLLGRLGVAVDSGLDGIDLFAPDAPRERGLYMECFSGYMHLGWSPLAGWLDANGKYLHSSRPEFYLPLQDPGELNDLAASRPRECEAARTRIAELLALPSFVAREALATAELTRAMAALGYARGEDFGAMPSPLEPSDRPSPTERKHVLEPLDLAQADLDSERYAQCRPLVEGILRGNPNNPMALDFLALCQMYEGEFPEARATLEHRVALAPTADALLNLGLCHLELDDPEAALSRIDAALALVPDHQEVQAARERTLQRLGR
jgi:tetratricopeptide (TPR) repeat protein